MNPDEPVVQIQKAATVQDIVDAHIAGKSGYEIAEEYGLETDKVKQIIAEADSRLAFVPPNEDGEKVAPIDSVIEPVIEPLAEGQDPVPGQVKGHK